MNHSSAHLLEHYIIIIYKIYRIKEFNEWAQCLVLELISKYIPSDSNEIFDIMNLLEDRLQHANGAVVLATIKVFLHLTMSMTDVHQQVPIKAALIHFAVQIDLLQCSSFSNLLKLIILYYIIIMWILYHKLL